MKKQFWSDSWQQGGFKTSFHKTETHPFIKKHLTPSVLKGKRILVPLCGKSVDLVYFKTYAAEVIGVEFVTEAINQFFSEQELTYSKSKNSYTSETVSYTQFQPNETKANF